MLIFNNDKKGQGEKRSEQLVDINEISVLMSRENYDEAKQKIEVYRPQTDTVEDFDDTQLR